VPRTRKRLPEAALLVLSTGLAGAVIFLTWPARGAVFCEQLPQLTALAVCAATLLVFSFRTLALASTTQADRRARNSYIAGSSAVLAALAFFLSAHFIAQYRKPCAAVQQQLQPPGHGTPLKRP
jgi:hypothetical protein